MLNDVGSTTNKAKLPLDYSGQVQYAGRNDLTEPLYECP